MPQIKKNRLVNRASGLYAGGKGGKEIPNQAPSEVKIDFISEGLQGLPIVPIGSLIQDPMNAREHPERNLEVIKQSLCSYGQVKPIVVRKSTGIIIAGNGTHRAATELGWTKIAVNYVDMTEVEAAGFGLVDNRSAELAKWNFEVVARIDALLQAENQSAPGWTLDELEILRQADWTPPVATEGDSHEVKNLTIKFSESQLESISKAIEMVKGVNEKPISDGEALETICLIWMQSMGGGENAGDQEIPEGAK